MITFKPWWPRYISLDIGFVHASAAYWYASDGENTYVYRELVRAHLTAPELATAIVDVTPKGTGRFDERKTSELITLLL